MINYYLYFQNIVFVKWYSFIDCYKCPNFLLIIIQTLGKKCLEPQKVSLALESDRSKKQYSQEFLCVKKLPMGLYYTHIITLESSAPLWGASF